MQSNPIVEKIQQEEAERRKREEFRYPFRVVCVFENAENNDFPVIRDVREFCMSNHIILISRPYNLDRHNEDMDIQRLPAFLIYYKNYVQQIHYYDLDPVYKLKVYLWAYQDEQRAKERAKIRRQEQWSTFVENVQSMFSLDRFKRKPALDLEASLSHTRDFNNTGGTPCEEQCTPHQTPQRGSPTGSAGTGLEGGPE